MIKTAFSRHRRWGINEYRAKTVVPRPRVELALSFSLRGWEEESREKPELAGGLSVQPPRSRRDGY